MWERRKSVQTSLFQTWHEGDTYLGCLLFYQRWRICCCCYSDKPNLCNGTTLWFRTQVCQHLCSMFVYEQIYPFVQLPIQFGLFILLYPPWQAVCQGNIALRGTLATLVDGHEDHEALWKWTGGRWFLHSLTSHTITNTFSIVCSCSYPQFYSHSQLNL